MSTLSEVFKHCFTGKDGVSWDVGRILWAFGVVSFMVYGGFALIHNHQPFDPQAYGIGFGSVLAAGGFALGYKSKTEPDPPA